MKSTLTLIFVLMKTQENVMHKQMRAHRNRNRHTDNSGVFWVIKVGENIPEAFLAMPSIRILVTTS